MTLLAFTCALFLTSTPHAGWPEPPVCDVDARHSDGRVGNAGCLVWRADHMLVIRHEESGRLANPGGYGEPGETAQCTAHRETWEETGVAVRVGPLLTRFDNGFLLYGCSTPLDGTGKTAVSLVVPHQAAGEIGGVLWVDPANLRDEQWRFPEYFEEMKRLFVAADPG